MFFLKSTKKNHLYFENLKKKIKQKKKYSSKITVIEKKQ